ncbi:MAG: tRNA modification GTPase [Tepidisphaeraceae bacterium]
MFVDDTIVAISSAAGRAARMVLRLSGPGTRGIAEGLGVEAVGEAFSATRGKLRFAGLSCPGWAYWFVGPRSYTGQDLVELHLPGNPLLARILLDWIVRQGARLAEPGEFTARAYLNGKMDLAQAEGVAAAISAQNRQHLAAARQLMAGELARRLRPALDLLAESLALVEAGIDFSEEGIQFLTPADAGKRIDEMVAQLESLLAESGRFEKLTHEPTIVLAGWPNAGKSTLTNVLAGRSRSVVSPRPGTTRDALSVEIALARGVVRLVDVAGVGDWGEGAQSPAEWDIDKQMRETAYRAVDQADVLVLVRDATDDRPEVSLPRLPDVRVASKADLLKRSPRESEPILISAITGLGMNALRDALDRAAFGSDAPGATLALTSRHLQCLAEAKSALARARDVGNVPELLAAELREALDALGQILGAITPDDILGKIFSTFCIGK